MHASRYGGQTDLDPPWLTVVWVLGLGGFAISGALVASRRPENPIGWLMCGVALFWALQGASDVGAELGGVGEDSVPAPEVLAWLAQWIWIPAIGLGVVFLPLLFPDGRPLSPRWRGFGWLAAVGLGLMVLTTALEPTDLTGGYANPFAVDVPGRSIVSSLGTALFVVASAGAVVSVILRLHRARGVERQQLKWFVFAIAPATIGVAVSGIVAAGAGGELAGDIAWSVMLTALIVGVPLATGIAILRYRLYEIDLVIRRTLVYGVLTALLAGLYFGIVIGLQEIFSSFAGGSDLAIAISTLAVAALFRPVRGWIQGFVDRRFYRRRYDAQQTLEAFSTRLRDEVDLDALGADLGAVVHETMRPAHVSLWLRAAEAPAVTIPGRSSSTRGVR
jgi:hypothetical protein